MKPSVSLLFIMVQFYFEEFMVKGNLDKIKSDETKDPCDKVNHIVIDEPKRAVGFGLDPESKNGQFCDRNLTEGWYHFKLNDVTAKIPTTCLRTGSCGGSVAMRINLEEQEMPEEGKEIHAWICGSFEILGHWDCCVLRQTTRIRNCGKFVIYYLYPVDRCPVSYCVQNPKENIPEELAVKQGEVADDILVQTTTATPILFTRCPEGQFKCSVNKTMTCTQKCNGVIECDDGRDEEECYVQTTMTDEIFPAPPPKPEDDYDSFATDSSGTGENDIINSTDDVIATRSLYSVNTTPLDTLQEGHSTSSPSQSDDNTQENTTPNTKNDFSVKHTTLVINDEDTTAASTLPNDVVSSDGGVTYEQKKSQSQEGHSSSSSSSSVSSSSPSNKISKLTTENQVSESDNTTDVSGAATSLKPDQSKHTATIPTSTTLLPSSVSPEAETSRATSNGETYDDVTAKTLISTASSTAVTRETVTKETMTSTTEMVMSSEIITEATTLPEDGRVVLVFRGLEDAIEDKPNCTAMIKLALSNVLKLMVSDTAPEYVGNQSIILTDGPTHHHEYVDLTFRLERENAIVPADRVIQFFRVLQHSQQNQLPWHQMGLKLVEFYKPGDRPEIRNGKRDRSLFKDNVILFMAIISIGSVCIIVIIFGLLYIRCRNRRRSWDRSSDMKSALSDTHPVHTVENPATDAEIMKDEINPLKETSLSTQGPRQGSQLPPGAPPEDENGWIIPLDQAQSVAVKTEDTRF